LRLALRALAGFMRRLGVANLSALQARAAGRLWDIDTGHDLMITEPALVADALLNAASLK